ncbi:MAG: type II secretion system protein [Pirellulales bacterium]
MINRSKNTKRQSGFTLIELVVVITLTGFLLSLSVTITSRCFTHASNTDRWNHFVGTMHLLGEDFRVDANAANQLLELTETKIRLSNESEMIEYEIQENAIVQQTTMEKETVSHESYPLAGCNAEFVQKTDGLISIQIRSETHSYKTFSLNLDAGLFNLVPSKKEGQE